MTRKSDIEKNKTKVEFLFRQLTGYLKKEIDGGKPSPIVIKEARQLLKDFSWMLELDDTVKRLRTLDGAVSPPPAQVLHPFPAEKQA